MNLSRICTRVTSIEPEIEPFDPQVHGQLGLKISNGLCHYTGVDYDTIKKNAEYIKYSCAVTLVCAYMHFLGV